MQVSSHPVVNFHVTTVNALRQQSGGKFMVVSRAFKNPVYSANIAEEPEVEITDNQKEAGTFENLLAAQSMAKSMSWLYGYKFDVEPCVS